METPEAAPVTLTFDFDAVTPRMLVDFKVATGVSLLSLVPDDGAFSLASVPEEAIAGIVWLALRMSGRPDATFDEALDTPFAALSLEDAASADPQ